MHSGTETTLRGTALVLALAGPCWVARAQEAPTAAAAAPSQRLVAMAVGLRNDRGYARMSLWDANDRWLRLPGRTPLCRAPIHGRTATCTFENLQPGGWYAVTFGHDENDNGHVDQGFMGWPLEGFGFSNDARPIGAAPSFERCRFQFRGGVQSVRITAQYM